MNRSISPHTPVSDQLRNLNYSQPARPRSLPLAALIGLLAAVCLFPAERASAQAGWNVLDTGITEDIFAMFPWPRPWMVGANGTVAYLNDAGPWLPVDVDATSDLRSIRATSSGGYYIGGAEGVFRYTSNGGATWNANDLPDTTQGFDVTRLGSTWFALGDKGSIFTTPNANGAWTLRESGTTSALRSVEQRGSTRLAVGDDGVLVRTDLAGEVWTLGSTGTTTNLNAIMSPGAGTWVVIGDGGLILKSTDDGITWNSVGSGTTAALRGLSTAGAVARILVVGDGGTLLESVDSGDTWCSHDSGVSANLYALATYWPDQWYAAGEGGLVLFSDDQGAGCSSVAIEPDAVETFGQGFQLSNPWPNPSSEGNPARLSLSIERSQHIRAEVFDLVGRRRAVLIDRVFARGESVTITVELEQFPAGTYFVRVQGAGAVETRTISTLE